MDRTKKKVFHPNPVCPPLAPNNTCHPLNCRRRTPRTTLPPTHGTSAPCLTITPDAKGLTTPAPNSVLPTPRQAHTALHPLTVLSSTQSVKHVQNTHRIKMESPPPCVSHPILRTNHISPHTPFITNTLTAVNVLPACVSHTRHMYCSSQHRDVVYSDPEGIRTPVTSVKGRCPRPG